MLELFVTFFKLGMFTIGGGVAMIPILRDIILTEKKWCTEEEAVDMISVCQSLPGVIAVNMATYVGFKRRGVLGSLVATIGVVIPSFVMILCIAKGMASFQDNIYIMGALKGLRAAAAGMIIIAVWQVGKSVIKDKFNAVMAVLSFILISALNINVVYVILVYILIGTLRTAWMAKKDGGVAE